MRKHYDQSPDPEDMFADTRMTFGEHIEDLRHHLLRAIYGFLVGMIIAFCIGKPVLRFIQHPVEVQLRGFWDRYNQKKLAEIEDALSRGQAYDGNRLQPTKVKLDLRELRRRLDLKPTNERTLDLVPAFVDVFRRLELDGAIDPQIADGDRWIWLQPDARDFARSLADYNRAMRPAELATLSVQEAFVVFFKVCLMTGLVISSPWVFFQIWAFVAAGLYPHEKRLVNVYMPFSLGLFLVGVFVCEFFVIPKAIEALLWFNEWLGLQPDLRLSEWLGFAIMMPLIFGFSFQTPLVMLFAERVGVMSVETYREKWKIAMISIVIFSAVITPSTDAVSMLLLAGPMYLLYELGIILCKLQGPRARSDDWETEEAQEMVEV